MEGDPWFLKRGGEVGLEVPDQLPLGAYRSVPNPWGKPLMLITSAQEVDDVGFADLFHLDLFKMGKIISSLHPPGIGYTVFCQQDGRSAGCCPPHT